MSERLAKVEALFHEALELPTDRRGAFLQQACTEDTDLQHEVAALLRASGIADHWLKETDDAALEPTPCSVFPGNLSEGPGTIVGRYKLLEKIGEGGFGAVYMAEQEEPVRRKVALKIIKLGMDTRSVIARFEAERQALALMDHPNIAKVFDAGATATGRPYFVMELVHGVPVTRFCQENELSITERLELFIQVCGAVQHAHQKRLIHRDIKPTNVLVTLRPGSGQVPNKGHPHPMLIDFGVAKAINQRLTEKTLFTNFAQMIGTPAYMSPEQAELSTLDVDTRSDVYSLGVLLYELLTGTTPFPEERLRSAGYVEMQRIICEEKPPRPSTRLTRTADSPPHSLSLIRHSPLATDLDWIVMTCLEKDRTRRYETANGLATDIQRHLNNEPVLARPPSRLYEFQKSVRRHKIGFAAAATVLLVLAVGVFISFWQTRRATHAEHQALEAQQLAEAQELDARRRAYASDMVVADQVLGWDNLRDSLDLLNRQKPEPDQQDLRGWEWRYLWKQTRSDTLITLGQEFGTIHSLAFSADTNYLAVGLAHRGGLSIWDLRARQEAIRLVANEQRVWAAFSPTQPLLAFASSSLLASGQEPCTLHLWSVETQKMLHEMLLDAECAGLAFSSDGGMLVTSTQGGHIKLWRLPDGTQMGSYPTRQSIFRAATCFAATPDLSLAAYTYYPSAGQGQRIQVIDLHDGRELWSVQGAESIVTSLQFSPDGKVLASAKGIGEPPVIKLWDVASSQEIGQLPGHRSAIFSMVFSPDGTNLISAGVDQTIRIWGVASLQCLDVLRGQAEPLRRLALSPDGRTLVSGGGRPGTVFFWDTTVTHPRKPYLTLPENVLSWCFAPDSHSVLTLNETGQVAQWTGSDFQQKKTLLEIGMHPYGDSFFQRFAHDGRLLAVGSPNGALHVWDLWKAQLQFERTNTTGLVVPVEFRSEGNTLFAWSAIDSLLREWDLVTGREIRSIPVPPWPRRCAFSPDGQLLIGTDEAGNVWRINLSDGARQKLNPAVLESTGVAFSQDGQLLAISSSIGFVRTWDTVTWRTYATNLYGLFSVAFSPDGKRLATGGGGGQAVNLWDTESWKEVLTLEGQHDGFSTMAFSPDGNVIAALNMAGTLHLWPAPTWEEIETEEKPGAAVTK